MLQINKIIRQLWCATYKGNDIDYIEIKTDDGETLGGADKRKVVNYRVVMVKKNFRRRSLLRLSRVSTPRDISSISKASTNIYPNLTRVSGASL